MGKGRAGKMTGDHPATHPFTHRIMHMKMGSKCETKKKRQHLHRHRSMYMLYTITAMKSLGLLGIMGHGIRCFRPQAPIPHGTL